MSPMPKSLCVFCGSRKGNNPVFEQHARKLAQTMAQKNIEFVYGGGSIGIMGILADEVLSNGGRVLGVIPQFLQNHEVGHSHLTELIITDSMHERKRTMFERSDGFIVLPGGLGTLDETFEIMTWKQLRLHDKPIIILDSEGYWNGLQKLIDDTVNAEFAHEKVHALYQVAKTPEEVFKLLENTPMVDEEVLTSHF